MKIYRVVLQSIDLSIELEIVVLLKIKKRRAYELFFHMSTSLVRLLHCSGWKHSILIDTGK